MPFNVAAPRPLKRRRNDDEDIYIPPTKHFRFDAVDCDALSDSSSMEIDDISQTATSDSHDYSMALCQTEQPRKLGYYGPGVLAFPQSLDVFDVANANWYWNASCWISNRTLDLVESNQICSIYQNHHGWAPNPSSLPAIQLGTSEDMIGRSTPRFSTYIVFPTVAEEALRSQDFARVWTDCVMVPSILHAARKREGYSYGIPPYARSYRGIKMVSDCQRIVSNTFVPDTPISVRMRGDELRDLWSTMQTIVHSATLPLEFQDMFLVVVAGQDSETGMQCFGSDLRSFWSHFSARWSRVVNMGNMEAERVHISPKEYYGMK